MSHEALIEDLRQKSATRIRQLRADAEDQVEKLRKARQKDFELHQAEVKGQQAGDAEKVAAPILHEAKRKALETEDEAMSRLVKRMYQMAEGMLSEVREKDYETTFAGLVKEVPDIEWETVLVNPADKDLATKFFPASRVETDPAIIGGFLASADGGKYQVVNTLKRRLEKGWPMILPLLLQEISKGENA